MTTTITNPLECFVTAWCVANSDPTSQWLLEFENIFVLMNFLEHFERFAISYGSAKFSYGSVVGMGLNSSEHFITQHATAELVQSVSSLFPCLEFLVLSINPANIEQMVPFLCSVRILVSLKMLTMMITDFENELPAAVSIPPLHCPSLTTVILEGRASGLFIQSLVLPNINTLTTIALTECRPTSGSEFSNFCCCLCQSTSLECLSSADVELSAHEEKELVSALEQISSLKAVSYNDTTILTYVGIRQLKQAMSSLAMILTYNEKELDDELRKLSKPLHSLISDHVTVRKSVTENLMLSPHVQTAEDKQRRIKEEEREDEKVAKQMQSLEKVIKEMNTKGKNACLG